jgi:hypothetical protein
MGPEAALDKGETAQVSTAWLYQQQDLKERILRRRAQQRPRPYLVSCMAQVFYPMALIGAISDVDASGR